MAATNRRAQAHKGRGSKKTSPYRMEARIKGENTSRTPKHRNRGWDEDN